MAATLGQSSWSLGPFNALLHDWARRWGLGANHTRALNAQHRDELKPGEESTTPADLFWDLATTFELEQCIRRDCIRSITQHSSIPLSPVHPTRLLIFGANCVTGTFCTDSEQDLQLVIRKSRWQGVVGVPSGSVAVIITNPVATCCILLDFLRMQCGISIAQAKVASL